MKTLPTLIALTLASVPSFAQNANDPDTTTKAAIVLMAGKIGCGVEPPNDPAIAFEIAKDALRLGLEMDEYWFAARSLGKQMVDDFKSKGKLGFFCLEVRRTYWSNGY